MQVAQTVVHALQESDILAKRQESSDTFPSTTFKFKQYEDNIFASYARRLTKKQAILIKRSAEITSVDSAAVKSKKHEKINVKFKFNDTCDLNERTFEAVLRNLLVCFQAKDCAEDT